MEIAPRLVGVIATFALVPLAVYWLSTGRLTTVTGTIGMINILLIAASVILAFSPNTALEQGTKTA